MNGSHRLLFHMLMRPDNKSSVTFPQNRLIFGRQVNERCDVSGQIWAAAVFDDETNFLENVDRFPTGETRELATIFRSDVPSFLGPILLASGAKTFD